MPLLRARREGKMARINTQRVELIEIFDFIRSLIEVGYGQISMAFDWRTGEWEVSWPNWHPEEEEEEEP